MKSSGQTPSSCLTKVSSQALPPQAFHLRSYYWPDESSESSEIDDPNDHYISRMLDGKGFSGSEILVIGAGSAPAMRWRRCWCSVEDFKRQLKQQGRLDRIIASKSQREVDSHQIAVIYGSHGLTAGKSLIYKDKKEEPLKQSFLDVWEHEPHNRDPREFENFWGIAVSLCTLNARRVRLVDMLGEESIINLLQSFAWSDSILEPGTGGFKSKIRDNFLRAVQGSQDSDYNFQALGDLWEQNPEWQKDLGDALQICLRVLSRTGYNSYRDEFHVLWQPPGCRKPRRVTLKANDQSWTRFLRDTTSSMTMAIMVEDSLSTTRACGDAQRCYSTKPSVLETAICVNKTLNSFGHLRTVPGCPDPCEWIWGRHHALWQSVWDVSQVRPGERVWIGAQTRLKILKPMNQWGLWLAWDFVLREGVRKLIGLKPVERISHWEYTDEEEEGWEVRPIPVHILS